MNNNIIGDVEISWLGNASFRIKGEGVNIYLDPCGLSGKIPLEDMADIILLTNENQQSCDPDSIRMVRNSNTTTLLPENMGLQFRGDARRVEAGDELIGDLCVKGISIEVVPSYNPEAPSGSIGAGVGYIITLAGKRIYYAGITGLIPEMQSISADIVILPVENCTMDAEQAVEAVVAIAPHVVIPVYYGCTGMNDRDIQTFRENVFKKAPGVKVLVPEDL